MYLYINLHNPFACGSLYLLCQTHMPNHPHYQAMAEMD